MTPGGGPDDDDAVHAELWDIVWDIPLDDDEVSGGEEGAGQVGGVGEQRGVECAGKGQGGLEGPGGRLGCVGGEGRVWLDVWCIMMVCLGVLGCGWVGGGRDPSGGSWRGPCVF